MPDTPIRSPHRTLIIPFAAGDDPACHAQWPTLALPQLCRWLAGATLAAADRGDAYRLSPPHERALASALGWPALADGTLPWAAWQAQRVAQPCAWFTPCHWQAGMEQVVLQPLDAAQWTEAESRALLAALAPLCAEDGIALVYESPQRWRAEGACFADLPSASLDRVVQRRIDPWLPSARTHAAAGPLMRLMNEAQMLFYSHPVNDARATRGLPLANGLWISGSGSWPGPAGGPASHIQMLDGLRAPALAGDWAAWRQAWETLDAGELAQALSSPQPLSLVLCGEHNALRWERPAAGAAWRERWHRWWPRRQRPAAHWLEAL